MSKSERKQMGNETINLAEFGTDFAFGGTTAGGDMSTIVYRNVNGRWYPTYEDVAGPLYRWDQASKSYVRVK